MPRYISVEDIRKASDPYKDWDVPTIDIVFCKDCKHYGVMLGGEFLQLCRKLEYTHHEEDDFCSWGEKKDE